MATGFDFSGNARFDPHSDPTSLSTRWNDWIERFNRFIVGMDIKDTTCRRALLLYLTGPEVETIFETLTNTGEDKDFDTAVAKLTEHFSPKKNNGTTLRQWDDKTLDQFHTRLDHLAKSCEFTDANKEIKTQLVETCKSTRVRRKVLREDISLAITGHII